jgi:hypothetical protein
MKNYFPLITLGLACFSVGLMNSCKKDALPLGTKSITEEFENVYELQKKGWVTVDNTSGGSAQTATWSQGYAGIDKSGVWHGFTAYSYTTLPDEFAYSSITFQESNYAVSSWLISPLLSVKNGDKLSFYTRGDTTGIFTDRMQVLMNRSASTDVGSNFNSVGEFTTVLFDINAAKIAGGYPTTWTKYEYSFPGISEKTNVRIAFRHYVENPSYAGGIGIDLFQLQAH